MPDDRPISSLGRRLGTWALALLVLAAIGILDYYTGVEVRIFVLYYIPIAILAWRSGRWGALVGTVLCDATWVISNAQAGLRFSSAGVWVVNTTIQGLSFATVGLLIATLRHALARERALGRIDALTSLLNSRAFYRDGARVAARCARQGRPVTVACIDLDNFKAVNDTLGHQAGDDVLRRVADALLASIRPTDIAGRLGGDEFVVLLPEAGPADAPVILERLRAALVETLASGLVRVTGSVGGATFLTVPGEVSEMVRECDMRMYEAKAAGKNRVSYAVVGAPDAAAEGTSP